MGETSNDNFKSILPLARVKKVMRLDDALSHTVDNQHSFMLSAESVPLVAKAADLFIEKLTQAAWRNTAVSGRRTLQKSDVAVACSSDESFDFLLDLFPSKSAPQHQRLVDVDLGVLGVTQNGHTVNRPVELVKMNNPAETETANK